jgi:hypothetical protein
MKWTSWDHRNERLSDLDLVMMKGNPHEYYTSIFDDPSGYDDLLPNIVQYTEANSDWDRRKVVMVNLTAQGMEIYYPVCPNKHYLFG